MKKVSTMDSTDDVSHAPMSALNEECANILEILVNDDVFHDPMFWLNGVLWNIASMLATEDVPRRNICVR